MNATAERILKRTSLHALHRELGARMVPFAGYDMPVQYPAGILAEHLHTREKASLFDVSHMGQVAVRGTGRAAALEALVPADIQGLAAGRVRYTMLTNEAGGIRDDLMVTNGGDHLFLIVNAACRDADLAHLRAGLAGLEVAELTDRSLLALQGPAAAAVIADVAPGAAELRFMSAASFDVAGCRLGISRSGYTGEDGFEISLPSADAEPIARRLLAHPAVSPAALGARDSLRLEAGFCLYGNDIDTTTTPIEAGLGWTIGRRRREEGGFAGARVILHQIKRGTDKLLVGIRPEGRAPARAHTPICDTHGAVIGEVTSGGFGPSVGGAVAMGYVASDHARPDTQVTLMVRGKARPARIVELPFVAHRYHKDRRRQTDERSEVHRGT